MLTSLKNTSVLLIFYCFPITNVFALFISGQDIYANNANFFEIS